MEWEPLRKVASKYGNLAAPVMGKFSTQVWGRFAKGAGKNSIMGKDGIQIAHADRKNIYFAHYTSCCDNFINN